MAGRPSKYSCPRHHGAYIYGSVCTCVIDPCKECGGRHEGRLPEVHPCPKGCGAGIRYEAHHVCIDLLPEAEAEHLRRIQAYFAATKRTVIDERPL